MSKTIIDVQNISKTFKITKRKTGFKGALANIFHPEHEYKKAVNDISFNIKEGEMVGFIGPNGAGKSTTVKMLSGILYPDSGNINIAGYIPHKQRKEYVANIGVVFGQKSQISPRSAAMTFASTFPINLAFVTPRSYGSGQLYP